MASGQNNAGATVNVSLSLNGAGAYAYNFNNAFDFAANLGASSGISVLDTANGGNDAFYLQASTSDTVAGGSGNDTFYVAGSASDLGGDALKGGAGVDVVRLLGSGATVDLTQGSSGIEAVVASAQASGEVVNLNLGQLSGSALTGGGAGPGKAFVALIGADGQVGVTANGFHIVGEVNAAGAGFAADGTALDAAATTALAAQVTRIDDVVGTLADDSVGSNPTRQAAAVGALNAYVFSNGSATYTVWTDGQVTASTSGGASVSAFQPAASVAPASAAGTFTQFGASGVSASATLGVSAGGLPTLAVNDGTSGAHAAISIAAGASGTVIHGDRGANGGDWFGLGKSGGGNQVVGSAADDVFDLQTSTSLIDALNGGGGFDIVRATADGADVDLTATNGAAARAIEAVVSGAGSTQAGGVQTVELNPNTLTFSGSSGPKAAQFAAMLGSTDDTVTLEGAGKWLEVATFAPGAPLPRGASALAGAADLDAAYGSKTHTAETALTGYVFESVGANGVALKYVTIYTDATIDNELAAPTGALLTQALAQYGQPSPGMSMPALQSSQTHSALLSVAHA